MTIFFTPRMGGNPTFSAGKPRYRTDEYTQAESAARLTERIDDAITKLADARQVISTQTKITFFSSRKNRIRR